jgi:uncharacterized protein (TIGR00369 family)
MTVSVPAGFEAVPASGFAAYTGPLLRDVSKAPGDAARFVFDPGPQHMNGGGAAHGGFLMSLAEMSMGYAAHEAAPGKRLSAVTMNADFLAAGKPGERIEMRAAIVRQTRTLLFMEGDLSAGGRLILAATGIWKVQEAAL